MRLYPFPSILSPQTFVISQKANTETLDGEKSIAICVMFGHKVTSTLVLFAQFSNVANSNYKNTLSIFMM